MKTLLLTFFYSLLCCSVGLCQYTGGTGKGNAIATATSNLGTNIFKGGSNDGVNSLAATTNLGTDIYKGGQGDGFASADATVNFGVNIFKGGSGDGEAFGAATTNLGSNIFTGGTGDGEAFLAVTTNLGTNIYKGGGGGDGWAMVAASKVLLPVTLSKFTGAWQQNDALLTWQTSSEINTKHFQLERSFNGADYFIAATISAAGSSNTTRDYKYTDVDIKTQMPASATSVYYRLKTVDKDGKESYSGVVVLKNDKAAGYVYSIYPNPAKQYIIVTVNSALLSKQSIIRITSQDGRILSVKRIQNLKETIEVAKLSAGIYYVEILDSHGFSSTQKLLIDK